MSTSSSRMKTSQWDKCNSSTCHMHKCISISCHSVCAQSQQAIVNNKNRAILVIVTTTTNTNDIVAISDTQFKQRTDNYNDLMHLIKTVALSDRTETTWHTPYTHESQMGQAQRFKLSQAVAATSCTLSSSRHVRRTSPSSHNAQRRGPEKSDQTQHSLSS